MKSSEITSEPEDKDSLSQDPIFKDIFYMQLIPELKRNNKCILVISHDDKYFQTADRIISLDNGQLTSIIAPAEMIIPT